MKSRNDPRHQRREHLLQLLFSWDYRKSEPTDKEIQVVIDHISDIDARITEGAPMWPISSIARVDLAILRLALWELYFSGADTPAKVVIDEAIELAKEYGGDNSGPFINGALGSIVKKYPVNLESTELPIEPKNEV